MPPDGAVPPSKRPRRRSRIGSALTSALLLWVVGSAALHAEPAPLYRGRRLIEVLQELRERGLNLVFSSALVAGDVVVTVEPRASSPRALLDEILPPLGLEAREGPGGSILIVGSPRAPLAGTVKGRVLSAARNRPVVRASVSVLGTGTRALTRPDGTFEVRGIPPGTYDVAVEAIGFVGVTVSGVRVQQDAPAELALALEAHPSYVEEIVVTPSRHSLVQQDQAARLTVGGEDVVIVPTIGGDVSRVVELLPGVAAADNSAAFNLRGSAARDVSLVLDGLELYEPFHLLRFQSPFSLVDSKIVDRIDVLSGGFTAEFGDRHGGFVELWTGMPEEAYRTRIELGTLNSRVSYGLPTSGGSLLLSARAWYPEALRDTTEFGEEGVNPSFGDLYAKLSFNVSPRTIVSAHCLAAYDSLEFVERDGNERVNAESRSGYLWVRGLRSWSPALFSQSIVSAGRLERSREGISEPEDETVLVDDDRDVDFLGLTHDMTWEVSASHVLKGGVYLRRLGADYRYSADSGGGTGPTTSARLDPSGTSFGAYVAHRASVSPRLATELGLRFDRQTYAGDPQISPRLNAIWRAGDRSEVRLGLGRFFQSQRIHELRIEDGETSFLPAELSRQAELTFQHAFQGGLRLRLDAYYRTLSRLHPRSENLFNPVELFPETEADRVLVAPARARLRGAELLLRSDPSQALAWWVSYARSSAEDVIDGAGVPRSWDQSHSGRFLVAYRWGGRWLVSLSGTAHTGWPTTPVSATVTTLPDGSTRIDPVVGPRNSDRFNTYARVDVKGSRTFLLPRGRLRLDLEVVNLTDRDNVCCVDEFLFEPRPDGTVEVRRELSHWLGITPSFSVLWEF